MKSSPGPVQLQPNSQAGSCQLHVGGSRDANSSPHIPSSETSVMPKSLGEGAGEARPCGEAAANPGWGRLTLQTNSVI